MKKEYLLFMLIPVSQCMIIAGNYNYDIKAYTLMGNLGILCSLAADAVLIYVLYHGSKKEKLERELAEVRYQRETEKIHMQKLEEQKKALLAMEEDFKEQLRSINKELEYGNLAEAERELEELQEKVEGTRPKAYCQNRMINAVLDEKGKAGRKLGADWQVDLLAPRDLKIEPLHLCSIFANMLDNALEAIEDLEEQKRWIQVTGEMKGNYFLIKVRNAATKAHAERRRREGRGNGTKILQMIAKQYEGTYKAEYQDGVYTAVVAVKGM